MSQVQVVHEWALSVFDIDNIYHIPCVRCRVAVPAVALRTRLRFTSILIQLLQRTVLWFGHAARCPDGELIRDPFLPQCHARGSHQMKTWPFKTKADLEHLSRLLVFGVLSPVSLHKTDEPGVPAQPALVECCHIYK